MSFRPALTLSTWLFVGLIQVAMGDLNVQGRSLRLANHSTSGPKGPNATEAPAAQVPAFVVNSTGGSNSGKTPEALQEAQPLLPPNVSQDLSQVSEVSSASNASNATSLRAKKSSASSGWVGCWYYGCRGSYHPEFYCQCNAQCKRFGNCCYDYGSRCWRQPQDSRRRRRRAPPPSPPPSPPPYRPPSPPPSPPSPPQGPANNGLVAGYHQTSPHVCKLIINSAFRPGSDGHCGGAIYFAMSPEATKTKAIGNDSKSGCIIKAMVDVGRVKHEGANCGHKWTKQEFLQTGYDSIRFDPGDGDEIVIFDSSRVKSMSIIPFNNAWRPTYSVR